MSKLWPTDNVAIGVYIALEFNVIAWSFQFTFDIIVSDKVLIEITFQLSSSKIALNLVIVPLIARKEPPRAFFRDRDSWGCGTALHAS